MATSPSRSSSGTSVRGPWERAYKAAGVPGLFFHDLRRSAVRNMDRAGVSRHVAMVISGHKTESMYQRYNIVSESDLRAAAEKTQMYLDSLPIERLSTSYASSWSLENRHTQVRDL